MSTDKGDMSPLDAQYGKASEVVATLMQSEDLPVAPPPTAEQMLEAAMNLQKLGLLEVSSHSPEEATLDFNAKAKDIMLAELEAMPNLERHLSPVSFVTAFSLWLLEQCWDRSPPTPKISLRQFLAMLDVLTTCLRQNEEQLPAQVRERLT